MATVKIEDFRNSVSNVLLNLGISQDKVDLFVNGNVQFRKIGVCIAITDIIDDELKKLYPNYDGSISTDTFDKIYDFNFLRDVC
jgi:hypothetical protein